MKLVGHLLEGKYEVLGEIARGGMGAVFRGVDQSLGRPVAIKILLQRYNDDAESVERFRREARAMASLDHPNVIPVYAIGEEEGHHYFVMKFLTGWTVSERLKRVRLGLADPFGVDEVRDILIQLCMGLEHAHQRGLIHRDIKPGNIMVDPNGHTTIMDFGIVKESEDDTLTKTGIVFGTPDYMAPEHAQGQAPGPATDVYSLGIVAYEMLTGEQPFKGSSPFSLVLKHIKQPPPPLVERREDIHQAFQDVIFKAIAKKPEDRYASAGAMADALKSLMPESPSMPSLSAESINTDAAPSPGEDVPFLPGEPSSDTGSTSVPKNRPSIISQGQVMGGGDAPSSPIPVLPVAEGTERPGHYSHLVTAVNRSSSSWPKTFRYGLITLAVVGAIGALVAFLIKG